MGLPLFQSDADRAKADVLALIKAGRGTSPAHTTCVNIAHSDGRGYASHRVTPETRAAIEAIPGWHEVTADDDTATAESAL